MAVTYLSSGAVVYSTGNPSPVTPTHSVGDMLILTVGTKPDTTPATAPAGWTLLGAVSGGTGTTGIDTGPMRVGIFYRIADGTAADTTGAITITGNNVSAAQVHVFQKTGTVWDIAGVGAADTTTGTPFSAVMPSNPGMTVGDMLFAIGVIPTDVGAAAQFSAETVAATGMTTVSLTEITEWSTATGQDMGGWLARGNVVTGTATAAPTVSATAGGTTTNVAGPIYLVRLREITPTSISASDSGTISATETSSITKFSAPSLRNFVTTNSGRSTSTTVINTINVEAGDLVVVKLAAETGNIPFNTVSGGALTWTQRTPAIAGINNCDAQIWTAVADTTGSLSVTAKTIANTGNTSFTKVMVIEAWANATLASTPVTFSATTTNAAPNQTVTTTGASSVISWLNADWKALDPTVRTYYSNAVEIWETGTPSVDLIAYFAYQNATSAGPQQVGMINPTGQASSIAGIEIQYAAPASPSSPVTSSDAGTFSATDSVASIQASATATESGTLSATESRTIASATATSDLGSISATESRTINSTSTTSDSGTLSATDASTLVVTSYMSTSDSGILSAVETANIALAVTANDSGSLSAAESSSMYMTAPAQDTGSISATDMSAVFVTISTSDSGTLSATESRTLLNAFASTDTSSVSGSDSSTAANAFASSDSGSVSAVESRVILSTIITADAGSVSATESTLSFLTVSTADSGTLSATDASAATVFQTLASTDTGSISAAESTAQAGFISSVDSGALSGVDQSASASTLASTDSGSLSAAEVTGVALTVASSDSGSLSVTDSSSIFEAAVKLAGDFGNISLTENVSFGTVSVNSVDAGNVSATDNSAAFKTITASDAGTVSATEGAVVFDDRLAADAGIFIGAETSSIAVFGTISKSSSDSGILSGLETSGISAVINTADSSTISATESRTIFSTVSKSDTGSITASDSATALVTLSSTDDGLLSVQDEAQTQTFEGFMVRVWDGTQFIEAALVVWNGSAFVDPTVQRWDGDSWV